jgi:hypothetical protein
MDTNLRESSDHSRSLNDRTTAEFESVMALLSSIESVRLQPGQFEGIGCERVTKRSEEIFLIR